MTGLQLAPGPNGLVPGARVFPLVRFLERSGATLLLPFHLYPPLGVGVAAGSSFSVLVPSLTKMASLEAQGFLSFHQHGLWDWGVLGLGWGGCSGEGRQESPRLMHRSVPLPPILETKTHGPCISIVGGKA